MFLTSQFQILDQLSIESSSEFPELTTILVSVSLSFVLSSIIAWTYEKTTPDSLMPREFLQVLVLVAIITATVMQAIGDSLARGLGMMGALSMVRFRTTLRTPRNMIFLFASLAVGIAVGVYGYTIGIVGSLMFCLAAFILRYSSNTPINNMVGVLKLEVPVASNSKKDVEAIIADFSYKYIFIKSKTVVEKKPKEKFIIMNGVNATGVHEEVPEMHSNKTNILSISQQNENSSAVNGIDELNKDISADINSISPNIVSKNDEISSLDMEYDVVYSGEIPSDEDLSKMIKDSLDTYQTPNEIRNIKLNFMDIPENA